MEIEKPGIDLTKMKQFSCIDLSCSGQSGNRNSLIFLCKKVRDEGEARGAC